jgi:hypothetical protein
LFRRTPQDLPEDKWPERLCEPKGELGLSRHGNYEPPTAFALNTAKACLAECEKRGFAPVYMGPSALGERHGGITLGFLGRFAMDFMNNGEVWLTFKTSVPEHPPEEPPKTTEEARCWRTRVLLGEIIKDGIAQPLPKGRELLVSWPIEASIDAIQGTLRLIREVVLGRIGMPEFFRRLAPSTAGWLDNFGGRE